MPMARGGEPHPHMIQAGLDAIPYSHPKLDDWSENFKGVRYFHAASGFEVSGAIDDLWQGRGTGKLIAPPLRSHHWGQVLQHSIHLSCRVVAVGRRH